MAESDLELAQLLCTRLCHDLAGPVGAVAAGVELIGGDPTQADEETLSLIGDSSAAASRKLKFLRAALGVTKGSAGNIEVLLDGYLDAVAGPGGKVDASLPPTSAVDGLLASLGPTSGQAILNLLLLALEMQPGCRSVSLTLNGEGRPLEITLAATGEPDRGYAKREDLKSAITGNGNLELSAKNVQAHITGRLIRSLGGTLDFVETPQGINVVASFPELSR